MTRQDPLKCFIEDGVLIIKIGVECLANAVMFNPVFSEYDEDSGEWLEPRITDADKLAADILSALKSEEEDGTTLVHKALDAASLNAIENGAEGVVMPGDFVTK